MGPVNIVLLPPPLDDYLGLTKIMEDLPVEHLISEFSIEGFVVSILSGACRLDEQNLDPDPPKPVPKRPSSKFLPVFDLV
jgi:hypothetical protein